jgi:outer membrane protein
MFLNGGIMKYLVGILSLLISFSILAGEKYAVVDMQRVILEVKQGKKAMATLKAEKAKKEKEIKAKQQEFLKQQKELEEMMKNPAADKAKAEAKYKALAQTYQMLQMQAQKMQQELMQKEQAAAKKILEKAQVILAKIVKKEKFTMVFNKAAVLYAPPATDITNQFIREYDKTYK